MLVTYHSRYFCTVKMRNKDVSQIVVIREVHLKKERGYLLMLKDVRHVMDLHLKLVSASKLDDAG